MPSKWRLRVGLDDRPGSMAAVASQLAAGGIDILRLDVVSRDEVAVDDIWVEVPEGISPSVLQDLDRVPGVLFLNVSPAYANIQDPVSVMAAACGAASAATNLTSAREAGIRGACLVGQAHHGLLLEGDRVGGLRIASASVPGLADVRPDEPCLARTALDAGGARVARGTDAWCPDSWHDSVQARWVAAIPLATEAPCPSALVLLRDDESAFQPGELTRLSLFGQVLVGILRGHAMRSLATKTKAARETA
ncbi:MAG: hypothetical protein WD533_00075, partial [Dehalococcoidia bacterium]